MTIQRSYVLNRVNILLPGLTLSPLHKKYYSCSAGVEKEIGVARSDGGNTRKGYHGTCEIPYIIVVASLEYTYTKPFSVGVGTTKSKKI